MIGLGNFMDLVPNRHQTHSSCPVLPHLQRFLLEMSCKIKIRLERMRELMTQQMMKSLLCLSCRRGWRVLPLQSLVCCHPDTTGAALLDMPGLFMWLTTCLLIDQLAYIDCACLFFCFVLKPVAFSRNPFSSYPSSNCIPFLPAYAR
jgi:hypothetical protein